MLQTHAVQTVFCSQVNYMLHKAKELVVQGGDDDQADVCDEADVNLVTVPLPVSEVQIEKNADSDAETNPDDSDRDSESDSSPKKLKEPSPVQKEKETMRMKTTNGADDYAHRGAYLKDFNFLTYNMYVRRVPIHQTADIVGSLYPFVPHYALAGLYAQEIRYKIAIPRLCSFNCPNMSQKPEENAMMKSLLLTPVACPGPGRCHHVARMFPMLGLDAHSDLHELQKTV